MQIKIVNPEQLESKRLELISELIELVKKQERSCYRYAIKLNNIRNKIKAIEKQLGE